MKLKSLIIASMIGLSLVTAITVGYITISRSEQIIANSAKEMLLVSSENKFNEIYNELKQVEKNVVLMGNLVKNASSINTQNDFLKLKDFSKAEAEYARIRIYPKSIGENTKWCMGTYFYFDQKYIPSYDGAWYIKSNSTFKRKMTDTSITKEDGGYYWDPIEAGKGVWAAPYIDPDLKIPMITYSAPVYKEGFLLGLAGMDITLDNLDQIIKSIKIYKNTDAFIVDKDFNFVAGKKFKVGDNVLTAQDEAYNFLENPVKSNKSGYIEYQKNGVSKIITYSTLSNGFILFIEVSVSEVLAEMNNMKLVLIFLVLMTMAITCIIAIKISEKISKPIENLSEISLKLANNDLTVIINEDESSYEINNLSKSFKKFVLNLNSLIRQISESAVSVSDSTQEMNSANEQSASVSQQVSDIANQLAIGSQEQTKAINKCLTNINKMSFSIHKISNNTNDVVKLAKDSENNADNGHNLAKKAVDKIKLIKETTDETTRVTSKLNNLASEINVIVVLIKNIASQTNLLALNAAIESARAGEHGKGFAVVADEVKKLAAQSAEATDKINGMIKQIQEESKNVSEAMITSTHMVEEGVIIVENVGANLEDILTATREVSTNSEEVSKLINDAVSNSDNILKIMENIFSIVEESAASTGQMASSTDEQSASLEEISASANALAKTAENLKTLVSVFKV